MENQESDLRRAASLFIKDLIKLLPGERFLIYVDHGSGFNTAKAIQDRSKKIGVFTKLLELDSKLKLPDLVAKLTDEIEKGNFDAICELSEQYFYQTSFWKRAIQLSARLYSLCGMNPDGFIRCVGEVNQDLMCQFGMALRRNLKRARSIHIHTKKGTDITLQTNYNLAYRVLSKFKRGHSPFITYPSGLLTRRIRSTFMGGQVAFQGIPETIDGTAVIDGYMWPPKELGCLDDPVILKIKQGRVIETDNHSPNSKLINKWLKGKSGEIQHFCIGFNPGAKLSGNIMEAERVFGAITIGINKYPFHTDGVIKDPTITVNNKIIDKDGTFV